MFVHRYHLPYYQQVAVYVWPILFFELWRVDLWQNETGRRAFVIPDKYGRAWVPWFEGMSQKPHLNGVYAEAYKPDDVDTLCPGWLERATSPPSAASATLHPARSGGWGLRISISHLALSPFRPWIPAPQTSWAARLCGDIEPLAPG